MELNNFLSTPNINAELYVLLQYQNTLPITKIKEYLNVKSRQTIYNYLKILKDYKLIDDNRNVREIIDVPQELLKYLHYPFIIKTYMLLQDKSMYTIKFICDILSLSYEQERNRSIIKNNVQLLKNLKLIKAVSNGSQGEIIIQQILEYYNIKYIKEKTFNDLVSDTKSKLRYDFYLPEYNRLIEFDGEQHYKATTGWNNEQHLKRVQQLDEIKNKYAKDKGYELIRIPYFKMKEIDVNMLLA